MNSSKQLSLLLPELLKARHEHLAPTWLPDQTFHSWKVWGLSN